MLAAAVWVNCTLEVALEAWGPGGQELVKDILVLCVSGRRSDLVLGGVPVDLNPFPPFLFSSSQSSSAPRS